MRSSIVGFRLVPVFGSILGSFLVACTAGPDYQRPITPAAGAYRAQADDGATIAGLEWWELFEDPVLQDLIETGLSDNRNLRVELARIGEARAALGIARSEKFPRVDYSVGTSFDAATTEGADGNYVNVDVLGGLSTSWEVDLWGRIARSNEAALNELLATEESFRAVTIALVADIAGFYLLLRDLDARLSISDETVRVREDALDITQTRFDAGVISEVDVKQAEIQVTQAEATVQVIERARAQTEHALALLLGSPPLDIPRGLAIQDQVFPLEIPAGLPSELLERRPDILAAERRLAAQTARIGVAEALKFPSLSLTGSAGVSSGDLTSMTVTTGLFNLGANLFGPLFNAGLNQQRVEIEKARTEQLVLAYEQTILNAFREVEDALVAVETYGREYEIRVRAAEAAGDALEMSRVRYEGGWTSYLEVLDIERSLFSAQLSVAETLQLRLSAVVDLYRALGGGWSPEFMNGVVEAESGR
ncbi:MAG: efflux transporter outer membrane subunit [Gemmatimonadota bacterium]